jgi:hypothetical protein
MELQPKLGFLESSIEAFLTVCQCLQFRLVAIEGRCFGRAASAFYHPIRPAACQDKGIPHQHSLGKIRMGVMLNVDAEISLPLADGPR